MSDSHGPSPAALGIGAAVLIIFLNGPANEIVRFAVVVGVGIWIFKGGMGGGHH